MDIGWLSRLTGGNKFAAAPGAKPTFGDHLQGIGSSMFNHYKRNMGFPGSQPAPQAQQDLLSANINQIIAGLGGNFKPPQMPQTQPALGQVSLPGIPQAQSFAPSPVPQVPLPPMGGAGGLGGVAPGNPPPFSAMFPNFSSIAGMLPYMQ